MHGALVDPNQINNQQSYDLNQVKNQVKEALFENKKKKKEGKRGKKDKKVKNANE